MPLAAGVKAGRRPPAGLGLDAGENGAILSVSGAGLLMLGGKAVADSGLGQIQVRFSAAVWNATHMVVSKLAVSAAEEGEDDLAFDATVVLDAAVRSIRRLPQDADSVLVSLSGEQWALLLDAVQ